MGYGKAKEVPQAIAKGVEEAKKNFFRVPMIRKTITHKVQGEDSAGVMLRPANPGTGVIAGGPVRAVLECAGIHDVLTKSLGSANALNIVRATVDGLKQLEQSSEAVADAGTSAGTRSPSFYARARAEGEAEAREEKERAENEKAAAGGEQLVAKKLKVTRVRSDIGRPERQRATMRAGPSQDPPVGSPRRQQEHARHG